MFSFRQLVLPIVFFGLTLSLFSGCRDDNFEPLQVKDPDGGDFYGSDIQFPDVQPEPDGNDVNNTDADVGVPDDVHDVAEPIDLIVPDSGNDAADGGDDAVVGTDAEQDHFGDAEQDVVDTDALTDVGGTDDVSPTDTVADDTQADISEVDTALDVTEPVDTNTPDDVSDPGDVAEPTDTAVPVDIAEPSDVLNPTDIVADVPSDPCGCGCPNDAINVADKPRYDADARAATARCSPFRVRCLADCIASTPACQAGRCVLQRGSP